MNYQRIYSELIQRALTRGEPSSYFETHHILPRCVTEDNSSANLVHLTAREHFIAHWLLVKIYKDTPYFYKLLYAFCMMKATSNTQQRHHYPSRLYERYKGQWKHTEEAKQKLSRARSGKKLSAETKQKLSETRKRMFAEGKLTKLTGEANPMYGKTHTEESRQAMSERQAGRQDSEATKQKKRERMLAHNPMKGKTHSDEVRQAISERFKGTPQSEEQVKKRTRDVAGSKHMCHPLTGERKRVKASEIDAHLQQGFVFGMKPC